jgi:putative transposase
VYKDAEDRPHACPVDGCGALFKKKGDLTKHTKSFHPAAPFVNASRHVRIHPSTADKAVLRGLFGSARTIYNATLDHCRATNTYCYGGVRSAVTREDNLPADKPWLRAMPSEMRKQACKEACDAYASNFAKRAKNPGHRFQMRYRSKKDGMDHVTFEPRAMSVRDERLHLFTRLKIFDAVGMAFDSASAAAVAAADRNVTIKLDALGRYWLLLPYRRATVENQDRCSDDRHRACAVDPGVRTFLTVYSPDCQAYKLGDGAANRIYRLMLHADKVAGLAARGRMDDGSRMSYRHKRRLREKRLRLEERIRGLVDELHWKCANFLVQRFDLIVIPPFETAAMSKRYEAARDRRRRIGRRTTRQMLRLRHFAFRQRLLYLASVHGKEVAVRGEEYTSKTCGHCGHIHATLGGAKVFRCPSCTVRYDRDAGGGARNIFIKNVSFS